MSDYIDRETAKTELVAWAVNLKNPKYLNREDAMMVLNSLPAANVVPVVHGRWIKYAVDIPEHPLHCSVCSWGNHHIDQRIVKEFKACPFCEARMDKIE